MRLKDKVVVITGAGHGLGRDASRLFASEGAKIVATDIVDTHVKSVADEIQAAGGEATYLKADVTSEADMEAAVQKAVDTFGRLDVMYCNAGIPEESFGQVPFVDTTLESFNKVVAVNLTGVFLGAKAAAKQFIAQGGGGNIVVTTSAAGLVAYPGFRSYVAAKAGANGLVRGLSSDSASSASGSTRCARSTGCRPTSRARSTTTRSRSRTRRWQAVGTSRRRRCRSRSTARRTSATNANLALFLASDDSAYMSGVCIPATDGGTFTASRCHSAGSRPTTRTRRRYGWGCTSTCATPTVAVSGRSPVWRRTQPRCGVLRYGRHPRRRAQSQHVVRHRTCVRGMGSRDALIPLHSHGSSHTAYRKLLDPLLALPVTPLHDRRPRHGTASLTCIVGWFARHPRELERVVVHPEVLPPAIEELDALRESRPDQWRAHGHGRHRGQRRPGQGR